MLLGPNMDFCVVGPACGLGVLFQAVFSELSDAGAWGCVITQLEFSPAPASFPELVMLRPPLLGPVERRVGLSNACA